MKVKFGAALLVVWMLVIENPNAVAFFVGLVVLCASVAQWSGPWSGVIAGSTLMLVAAWPFLARRSQS